MVLGPKDSLWHIQVFDKTICFVVKMLVPMSRLTLSPPYQRQALSQLTVR